MFIAILLQKKFIFQSGESRKVGKVGDFTVCVLEVFIQINRVHASRVCLTTKESANKAK
jgi:hypothetical protein